MDALFDCDLLLCTRSLYTEFRIFLKFLFGSSTSRVSRYFVGRSVCFLFDARLLGLGCVVSYGWLRFITLCCSFSRYVAFRLSLTYTFRCYCRKLLGFRCLLVIAYWFGLTDFFYFVFMKGCCTREYVVDVKMTHFPCIATLYDLLSSNSAAEVRFFENDVHVLYNIQPWRCMTSSLLEVDVVMLLGWDHLLVGPLSHCHLSL